MPLPLWAYGAIGGATVGWAYGDSWQEMALGAAMGTKGGSTLIRHGLVGTGKGMTWIARTNVVRASTVMGAQATAAVAGPIAVGYAASYAIAGKSGTSDFHQFITGGVSPKQYWDTVTLKSMR